MFGKAPAHRPRRQRATLLCAPPRQNALARPPARANRATAPRPGARLYAVTLTTRLASARERLARRYLDRRLSRKDFTVVSDDCWGGQVYSVLGLKCHSPFIGMGVRPQEYIPFLEHMRDPGALDVLDVSTRADGHYHLLKTRHATLHGMHYDSAAHFHHTYERRLKTILWDRLFIKVDFGKKDYTQEHIARWNELRLPNSVALYPDIPRFRALRIHNGVALPGWELDGAKQFHISCRHFDIFAWLDQGVVRLPAGYRCMQALLMENAFLHRCRAPFRFGRTPYRWHR